MDDFKRVGHLHDGNWSGRKLRKADKARARAAVKRDTQREGLRAAVDEAVRRRGRLEGLPGLSLKWIEEE